MKIQIDNRIFKSKLFMSAYIYTLSNVINSAIPFFLLPILTRYLTPLDYGIVSMFGVLVSFVTPFTGLSIHGAISRVYYERDSIDIKVYVGNCLFILLISTIIVGLFFYFFSDIISEVSSVPSQILWMVVIISSAQFVSNIVLVLFQVQEKPIYFGLYSISQSALNMLLSITFVVIVGLSWNGRLYAQFFTFLFFLIISLIVLIKNNLVKFEYNRKYIEHALKFGIPLVPHALSGVIISFTDRIFITNMIGVEATGIYTIGYQIGMIINLLSSSFNQAYVPWLFSKLKENIQETKRKIVKLTYGYFIVIFLIAIILSTAAPYLLKYLVGNEFNESGKFVIWIALGYAFNGMYLMVTNYIFYVQKTVYLMIITVVSAIINIILNYILIKKNGSIGAAQATTLVYLVKFILTWILSSRIYNMPWNLRNRKTILGGK